MSCPGFPAPTLAAAVAPDFAHVRVTPEIRLRLEINVNQRRIGELVKSEIEGKIYVFRARPPPLQAET